MHENKNGSPGFVYGSQNLRQRVDLQSLPNFAPSLPKSCNKSAREVGQQKAICKAVHAVRQGGRLSPDSQSCDRLQCFKRRVASGM